VLRLTTNDEHNKKSTNGSKSTNMGPDIFVFSMCRDQQFFQVFALCLASLADVGREEKIDAVQLCVWHCVSSISID
jgi:hypothetical protein